MHRIYITKYLNNNQYGFLSIFSTKTNVKSPNVIFKYILLYCLNVKLCIDPLELYFFQSEYKYVRAKELVNQNFQPYMIDLRQYGNWYHLKPQIVSLYFCLICSGVRKKSPLLLIIAVSIDFLCAAYFYYCSGVLILRLRKKLLTASPFYSIYSISFVIWWLLLLLQLIKIVVLPPSLN